VDLAKYTELTGITVAEADKAHYSATIRRANALLEAALGYSLSESKNLDKEELGKVQFNGLYPYYPYAQQTLLPADTNVEGSYRLFSYNDRDTYLKIDPARNVYHVKLVQAHNDDEFVTIMDLKDFTTKNSRKFSMFLQKQTTWFNWQWYGWLTGQLGHGNALMLAVDADWLTCNNMPDDLRYLWADMVTYYSSANISVTGNVKSESINGHSYTLGEVIAPEQSVSGLSILGQYAGPNGLLAPKIRAL
jgi:hypothetical protein